MDAARADMFALEGPLTMRTVGRYLEEGRARVARGPLVIDFTAVTECDSAALALVFDWWRAARAAGSELRVRSLPASLESLADLYGATELLPAQA